MSTPLPEAVNHRRLCQQQSEISGVIKLSEFSRLKACLQSDSGVVEATVSFDRNGRRRLVLGQAEAEVTVQCQNCLEPLTIGLSIHLESVLVNSEEQGEELEDQADYLVAADDYLKLVDILEDELILALPMVPKHEPGECEAADLAPTEVVSVAEPETTTYKAFAALAEMKNEILGKK